MLRTNVQIANSIIAEYHLQLDQLTSRNYYISILTRNSKTSNNNYFRFKKRKTTILKKLLQLWLRRLSIRSLARELRLLTLLKASSSHKKPQVAIRTYFCKKKGNSPHSGQCIRLTRALVWRDLTLTRITYHSKMSL